MPLSPIQKSAGVNRIFEPVLVPLFSPDLPRTRNSSLRSIPYRLWFYKLRSRSETDRRDISAYAPYFSSRPAWARAMGMR